MLRRKFGWEGLAILLCLTMIWSGCSTEWIAEAERIVSALIPAAANLVTLVAVLEGKSVSAADLTTIQNAGTQAGADLQLVQSLIAAYQKADAAAKPGILNQIQSAIGAVQGNMQGLLASVHIKDVATQAKVTAVVGIVAAEVESLAAVVPQVQGIGIREQGAGRSLDYAEAFSAQSAEEKRSLHQEGRVPSTTLRGVEHARVPLSASEFVKSYNSTLIAKTGNAELDRVTAGLQIHLHGKLGRMVTVGVLK